MSFKIGDRFEERFVVTEVEYRGFMNIFKDTNPLHTDELFARSKGFESRVMHGNILNGFLSFFIGECLPSKNVIIHSQQISYRNPVYLNEQLVLEAEIVGVYDSVNAIEFNYSFKNTALTVLAKGKFQIGILQ